MAHEGRRVDVLPGAVMVDAPPPPVDAPPPPVHAAAAAVVAHYQLTRADVLTAGVAASRYSVVANGMGASLIASGLLGMVTTPSVMSVLLIGSGVLFLSGYGFGWLSAFLMSRRPDLLRETVELRADPDGLQTATSSMTSGARWSAYRRIRPTGRVLLLELGTGAALLVPVRALSPDGLGRVLHWAETAGVLDRATPFRQVALGVVAGVAGTAGILMLAVAGISLGV